MFTSKVPTTFPRSLGPLDPLQNTPNCLASGSNPATVVYASRLPDVRPTQDEGLSSLEIDVGQTTNEETLRRPPNTHAGLASTTSFTTRKPSGRLMKGRPEEVAAKPDPVTPPGEVAGVSFAPHQEWISDSTSVRPHAQVAGCGAATTCEERPQGGRNLQRGAVLARQRPAYKLPPLPVMTPLLVAEGISCSRLESAGGVDLDSPHAGAHFGSTGELREMKGAAGRVKSGREKSNLSHNTHVRNHRATESMANFAGAGYGSEGPGSLDADRVHMFPVLVDEQAWRYRSGVESCVSSVVDSINSPKGWSEMQLPSNGNALKPLHLHRASFDATYFSMSFSIPDTDIADSPMKTPKRKNDSNSFIAAEPLWSSLERTALMKNEHSVF